MRRLKCLSAKDYAVVAEGVGMRQTRRIRPPNQSERIVLSLAVVAGFGALGRVALRATQNSLIAAFGTGGRASSTVESSLDSSPNPSFVNGQRPSGRDVLPWTRERPATALQNTDVVLG